MFASDYEAKNWLRVSPYYLEPIGEVRKKNVFHFFNSFSRHDSETLASDRYYRYVRKVGFHWIISLEFVFSIVRFCLASPNFRVLNFYIVLIFKSK